MYTIKVDSHFSSAHNLRGYKGKCEALHGHNWKVALEVRSPRLDAIGMVIDFTTVKKELKKVLEKLDHTYLNKIPYFKKHNPTSEHIAQFIFEALVPKIPQVYTVTVWESDYASATYSINGNE